MTKGKNATLSNLSSARSPLSQMTKRSIKDAARDGRGHARMVKPGHRECASLMS